MFESRLTHGEVMKLKAALLSVSVAIGLHIYLALHYYQLNFGLLTGESLCNVNDLFNCDTVTASSFSAVFGIPIALWGAATNAVLAILIMGWILGWTSDPARQGRYTLWLSGLVAATSVVMGSISTFFIGSFCLFCMGTYLTSFIAFALIYKSQEADSRTSRQYFTEAFSSGKSILYFLIAIPAVTVFFHYSYTSKVGASEMGKAARLSVADWKAAPTVDLSSAQPSFTLGPDN
ncbi:MAG: hypothetical protein KDD38_06115, partial [Bdellovibrionales bacterium]|nr:hypothetical protein [Bdellovibrionales bacterium]